MQIPNIISKLQLIEWKPKFLAFAVHFGISLIIFFALLYLILVEWYPHPFFTTDGGTQGLRLIILVDLVLGPTLTFIVFNKLKPSLKFDLFIIATLQILALTYGVWVVHNERPIAVVFSDDRLNPIPYYQVLEAGIELSDLKKYDGDTPVKIYVEMPTDQKERADLFLNSYRNQQPIFLMGDRYRKIDAEARSQIAEKSIDMESYLEEDYLKDRKYLRGGREKMQATYQQFMATAAHSASDYLFVALFARYGQFIVVLDRETFEFVDVLDILPPQITKYTVDAKASP